MNYKIEFIPGTLNFVLDELKQKFPEVIIEKTTKNIIMFSSTIEDIDQYRELYSVIRIEKENGMIRNLFRRDWRKEFVPAGINPALAYIMCQIANIQAENIILDPFCGGGTIAITAAKYFPVKRVMASDLSGTAVDITIRNAKLASLGSKLVVFRTDVKDLKIQEDYIDRVITNLPFGVRTGDHESNIKSYKVLKVKMDKSLKKGGIAVILTQEKKLIEDLFNKTYKINDRIDVEQGGLQPCIFKIVKLI